MSEKPGFAKRTVFRNAAPNNFTTIPNATLRDKAVSLEARGLLVFVLSFPANWHFRLPWLIKETGIGRDKAYKLVNDLIAAKYCERLETRTKRGKIEGYEYLFTDTPGRFGDTPTSGSTPVPEKPETEQPVPDLPGPAQPLTANQEAYKEGLLIKTHSEASRSALESEVTCSPAVSAGLVALREKLAAITDAPSKSIPLPVNRRAPFLIKPDTAQWRAWMEFFETNENEAAICEARAAGQIVAQTLWPPSQRKGTQ